MGQSGVSAARGSTILTLVPKIFLLGETLYLFSTGFTKLSILFFYRRFARSSLSKAFMWDIYIMIALQIGYMISGVIILPLQCQPMSAIWNQFNPAWAAAHPYHCINRWAFTTLGSTFSVMQDLAAFLLPLPLVWGLATSRLHKLGATAIFAGGLCVTAVGAVRVWFATFLWRPDADNSCQYICFYNHQLADLRCYKTTSIPLP